MVLLGSTSFHHMLTELGLTVDVAPLQSGRDCPSIILPVKFCKQTLTL